MILPNTRKRKFSDRLSTPSVDPGLVVVGTNNINAFHSTLSYEFAQDREKIIKYRRISRSMHVDSAIDDIVNEAIGPSQQGQRVTLDLAQIDLSPQIKSKIVGEFEKILSITNAQKCLQDDFRSWYVDGKAAWIPIPHDNNKLGIREVRKIDSRFISKITKISLDPNQSFEDNLNSFSIEEAFVFFPPTENDYKGELAWTQRYVNPNTQLIELNAKMVVYQESGIQDEFCNSISYLDNAIRPLNQLSMQEDSQVIYRLVRAPERRAWYVDVGNVPKGKAEEYIKSLIEKQKSRIAYNSSTGAMTSSADVRSILDDLYIPTRDGRGTKVEQLPGGSNLSDIDDILYFQANLYRALKVPVSRIRSEGSFSLGRSAEITRDEVKFYNFIQGLISKHSNLYRDLLGIQLVLTKVMTLTEWNSLKDKIHINYSGNSFFAEMKKLDIMVERLNVADRLLPYVENKFIDKSQIHKVLNIETQNSDDIQEQDDATTFDPDEGQSEFENNPEQSE